MSLREAITWEAMLLLAERQRKAVDLFEDAWAVTDWKRTYE